VRIASSRSCRHARYISRLRLGVRLDISHDGQSAVLREASGRETILQRVSSTLGTRYAGDGVSVLRSGDVYIYTVRDGSTLPCDLLPR
jgi:hypothetical protein